MKTEKEIVEELTAGRASAYDTLYGLYSTKLYYFALSILKSREDAEEVVQNTFFKIWEKRKSIESNHSFKSFLFTIAYNLIIDILREKFKEKKYRDFIQLKASANYNIDDSIEYSDLLRYVGRIVNELSPRKNEIYKLNKEDHLSYIEIAQKLNITPKTVENSLNYSVNFIKKRLGSEGMMIVMLSLFL